MAHAVTDSAGTFVLVAPGAGVYRVGFEILGWERLVGPADTLRDGEMRERAYPLAFGETPERRVRRRPSCAGARARAGAAPRRPPPTPTSASRGRCAGRARVGSVVAQYVVDPAGRVRSDSWRPIASTHADYLAALRAHAPAMRYEPARLDGSPSASSSATRCRFDWVGPMPTVTLSN